MTREPVALEALLATRARLTQDIRGRLDANSATFLLSLHEGAPDFGYPMRKARSINVSMKLK